MWFDAGWKVAENPKPVIRLVSALSSPRMLCFSCPQRRDAGTDYIMTTPQKPALQANTDQRPGGLSVLTGN